MFYYFGPFTIKCYVRCALAGGQDSCGAPPTGDAEVRRSEEVSVYGGCLRRSITGNTNILSAWYYFEKMLYPWGTPGFGTVFVSLFCWPVKPDRRRCVSHLTPANRDQCEKEDQSLHALQSSRYQAWHAKLFREWGKKILLVCYLIKPHSLMQQLYVCPMLYCWCWDRGCDMLLFPHW